MWMCVHELGRVEESTHLHVRECAGARPPIKAMQAGRHRITLVGSSPNPYPALSSCPALVPGPYPPLSFLGPILLSFLLSFLGPILHSQSQAQACSLRPSPAPSHSPWDYIHTHTQKHTHRTHIHAGAGTHPPAHAHTHTYTHILTSLGHAVQLLGRLHCKRVIAAWRAHASVVEGQQPAACAAACTPSGGPY